MRGAPGPAGGEHLPRLDVVQRVLVLLQVLQLGGDRDGEHDDALTTAAAAVVVESLLRQTEVDAGQTGPDLQRLESALLSWESLEDAKTAARQEWQDTFDDSQWTDIEWTAVTGAVELTVDSLELEDDYGMPAIGTITVRDALLSADGQDDIAIDEISWTAEIGWIEAG